MIDPRESDVNQGLSETRFGFVYRYMTWENPRFRTNAKELRVAREFSFIIKYRRNSLHTCGGLDRGSRFSSRRERESLRGTQYSENYAEDTRVVFDDSEKSLAITYQNCAKLLKSFRFNPI